MRTRTPTAPTASRGAPLADRTTSAAPIPVVADTVGRPWIGPHRLAQTTRDYDAVAADDYNQLRPGVRHVEIDELFDEPILSRFGGWAYKAVDWLCPIVMVFCISLMAAAYISHAGAIR